MAAFAQQEAMNWYFGNQTGLSFRNGCPTPLMDGAMKTEGGSAVISHKDTGDLLFYTNGRTIWNRHHQPMPNGGYSPLNCQNAIGQPAMIVPVPGQEHRYYVFALYHTSHPEGAPMYDLCPIGVLAQAHSFDVRYSVVDMRLDGGRGDVVVDQKSLLLQKAATEKLTAIPHSNGRDYWLLTHGWDSNAFFVYRISPDGLSGAIVQHIGSTHSSSSQNGNRDLRGVMKASPDGKMLAAAVNGDRRPMDLFQFDAATGRLSNHLTLGYHTELFGLSFSPDNTKLYVANDSLRMREGGRAYTDNILQYDLSAGDAGAVIASAQSIMIGNPALNRPSGGPLTGYMDMQLAPDGRIYVISSNLTEESGTPGLLNSGLVINRPNEKGFACDVQYFTWGIAGKDINAGLPNFMQSYFQDLEPVACPEKECVPDALAIYPNPAKGTVRLKGGAACHAVYSVRIVNAIGQQMGKVLEGVSLEDELDVSGLSAGMYLIILSSGDQLLAKKKVIILN